MPMVMPGYQTRSAADVAHQYAGEQLQQQELDLRAQGQQAEQAMQAQRLFQQERDQALRKLEHERILARQEQELSLMGSEAAITFGMKYDPATKSSRPLTPTDPEWSRWKERDAEQSAMRKARLAEMEARTPEAQLAYQERLLKLKEPYEIAGEARVEKREAVRQRQTFENQQKLADIQFERTQRAKEVEDWRKFQYEVSEAEIKHNLEMKKLELQGEQKETAAEAKARAAELKQQRGEVNKATAEESKARAIRSTQRERILNAFVQSAKAQTGAWIGENVGEFLTQEDEWFGQRRMTRLEIAQTPQYLELIGEFDRQVEEAQAKRLAAEKEYDVLVKAGTKAPTAAQPGASTVPGTSGAPAAAAKPAVAVPQLTNEQQMAVAPILAQRRIPNPEEMRRLADLGLSPQQLEAYWAARGMK